MAQTTVFHEDFETADSVASSGNPVWSSNAVYQAGGLLSYRNQVALNDSSRLTTISFSTLGSPYVFLEFDQICKIQFLDNARIEVSNNNGNTWQAVTSAHYLGAGIFGAINNRFCSASYPDWLFNQDATAPSNTWWKHETFDLSALCANAAGVLIRFKLSDGNGNGPGAAYGWLLDNIKVTGALSEITPPVISYQIPLFLNSVYSSGPFPITAEITDTSGVDTAYVYYTVNGGPQQVAGMNNTSGNTWVGNIPSVNFTDTVCYYIMAVDGSLMANTAVQPSAGCRPFIATAPLMPPFMDDFEVNNLLWTEQVVNGMSVWQYGAPAFGLTTGANSGLNAWDINLITGYASSSRAELYTPVFDFSQTVNARMSFWHNYNTEQGLDGMYIEYTTDNGSTWHLLGTPTDPNAVNWYTDISIYANNSSAWSGQSNGWVYSEYQLSSFNSMPNAVQFRFVFVSDPITGLDGYSIDDFQISLPFAQDIQMRVLEAPDVSNCVPSGSNTIDVRLFNAGGLNINGPVAVSYQLDNNAPVTEQFSGSLLPAQTAVYSFLTPVNISPGTHTITLYTSLVNDGYSANDTLRFIFNAKSAVSVPYFNGFETTAAYNDFCVTNTTWGQVNQSPFAAITGSQGALFDAQTGTTWNFLTDTLVNSPNYIWLPSVNRDFRSNLRLIVNSTGYSSLALEFDNFLSSNPWTGASYFRVLVNGVMISPHLQSQSASMLTTYRFDLTPFLPAASIAIDFEAKVGDNFLSSSSGVLLDNVRIFEIYPQDAMVEAITDPTAPFVAGSQHTVKVKLRNNGANTLTSIPVQYQIGSSVPVVQTWTGSLAPNTSAVFTFTVPFTVPAGAYTICAWTSLLTDGNLSNDTACVTTAGLPVLPLPFSDNFDGPSTFFTPQNSFSPSWQLGTPLAPQILNAHSAPNAWEVNLGGAYQPDAKEYLYSPFFDFSGNSYVRLKFWHAFSTDTGGDGCYIEYSTDAGANWIHLGVFNDQAGVMWYNQSFIFASNTPGWSGLQTSYIQSEYNLTFLNGNPQPVQFRFALVSDPGVIYPADDGWAIDGFELISTVGLEEITGNEIQLSCSPNPASQTTAISFTVLQAAQAIITLRDITGKTVFTESSVCSPGIQVRNIDVSTLPAGVYSCEVEYNGARAVRKIVVYH
ncbi:MAG: immune inhibitor A [Bacteroidetes bacterium]|nr:immune inhibitor A [Bacteroidota bacterium]